MQFNSPRTLLLAACLFAVCACALGEAAAPASAPFAPTNSSSVVLQIDFPFLGPWGAELAAAFADLAASIAAEPGFLWKIWTENKAEGLSGGIYAFEDRAAAEAYLQKHTARLAGFNITDIRGIIFDVNPALDAITLAPLP